jgi:hypothetical protein
MHKIGSALTLMLLLLFLSVASVALADGPAQDKGLPPGIEKAAPTSVERVVGERGTEALCDSLWWHGVSNLILGGLPDGDHYSRSRDADNHSYACDIDQIGTRGRFWSDNNLRDDSGMQYAYNSAASVFQNGGGDTCSSNYIYIRGNHYFKEGAELWQPETSNSC